MVWKSDYIWLHYTIKSYGWLFFSVIWNLMGKKNGCETQIVLWLATEVSGADNHLFVGSASLRFLKKLLDMFV